MDENQTSVWFTFFFGVSWICNDSGCLSNSKPVYLVFGLLFGLLLFSGCRGFTTKTNTYPIVNQFTFWFTLGEVNSLPP